MEYIYEFTNTDMIRIKGKFKVLNFSSHMIIVTIITLSELFQFDEPRFHPTTLRLLLNKGEQEPISQSSTMPLPDQIFVDANSDTMKSESFR